MPPTAPETVPTVCIIAAGSFDFGARDTPIQKKKPTAETIMTAPVNTTRRFINRSFFSGKVREKRGGSFNRTERLGIVVLPKRIRSVVSLTAAAVS
ncbi:MAG TPA: hypothetical protein VM782_06810 [Stellaceae bacterium]|nr:hypothetical protein [Stellaceae bacterium]